jgi:hypothetical protein
LSQSERGKAITDLAGDISARLVKALEENRLGDIPDDSLGQLFASAVRAYSAKAQAGDPPRAFARGHGVTATDAMIGCTAMLDGAGVPLFELGTWQAWSTVGRRKRAPDPEIPEVPEKEE